jgi:hypothetical protein
MLLSPALQGIIPTTFILMESKMTTWHDYLKKTGQPPSWPYPIRFEQEQELDADVLVIGGGIAGCWAAISAAREGVKVVLLEKGDTVRSGAGGPGCDHWCNVPANPHSRVNPDEWAEHMEMCPGAAESVSRFSAGKLGYASEMEQWVERYVIQMMSMWEQRAGMMIPNSCFAQVWCKAQPLA